MSPVRPLLLSSSRRWAVVLAVALGLLLLAQVAVNEQHHAAYLGISARADGARLVVDWVQPGGWGFDAGVRPGDEILAIDGQPAEAAFAGSLTGATEIRTFSAATGAVHEVPGAEPPVPVTDDQRLRFLLMAGLFFAIGGVVFVLAAEVGTSSLILGLATAAAGLLIAPTASTSGASWVVPVVIASVMTLGTCAFLFFLKFPIDRLGRPGARIAAGLSIGSGVVLVAVFGWVTAFAPAAYEYLQRAIVLHVGGNLLAAIALMVLSIRGRSPEQRAANHMLRLVGLGTVAALAPFVFFSLVPFAAGLGYLLPPDVTILTIVFLPGSLGAAVLSHQFLGIERLLRRGLVALTVWVALIGVCAQFSTLVPWPLLTVSVTAVASSQLTRGFRRKLEGLLFRDVYDAREVVQAMGNEIVLLSGLEPIATSVLERLGRTLDLSWATLSLDIEDRLTFTWGTPDDRQGTLVPLVTDNLEIGSLMAGPKRKDVDLLPEDRELLRTLAPLVATAVRGAVLTRRLEDQVIKLVDREVELGALSARLMQVQEDERRRLALDLHDDPLQRAVLLARSLGSGPESTETVRWRESTEEIIISLRALCQGLRPRTLDDFGLQPGLEWLLTDVGARSDLATHLEVCTDDGLPFGRLEPDLEVALYRVAQEAVNNAVKHAEASALRIELARERDQVRLRIADDGRGLPTAVSGRASTSTQLGLLGMRERIAPWGGVVTAGAGEAGGTLIGASVRFRVGATPHSVGVAA